VVSVQRSKYDVSVCCNKILRCNLGLNYGRALQFHGNHSSDYRSTQGQIDRHKDTTRLERLRTQPDSSAQLDTFGHNLTAQPDLSTDTSGHNQTAQPNLSTDTSGHNLTTLSLLPVLTVLTAVFIQTTLVMPHDINIAKLTSQFR
jgi:hypothetical protein